MSCHQDFLLIKTIIRSAFCFFSKFHSSLYAIICAIQLLSSKNIKFLMKEKPHFVLDFFCEILPKYEKCLKFWILQNFLGKSGYY